MGLFKVTDKRFALYGMTVVLFALSAMTVR